MLTMPQSIFGTILLSVGIAGLTAVAMSMTIKVHVKDVKDTKEQIYMKDQNSIPLGTKGDSERTIRVIPIIAKTIPIKLEPTLEPEPKPEPKLEPKPSDAENSSPPVDPPARQHVTRSYGGDICSRHGGRKVETHHGRSWHCVF